MVLKFGKGCREIYQISKLDCFPLVVTFIGCLFDTADGILIGIAVHLIILLYRLDIENTPRKLKFCMGPKSLIHP